MTPHRWLYWKDGSGVAECGDVRVHLRQCPRLPGMRFLAIEYIPRVKRRVVAEDHPDIERDMTEIECTIADNALERMAALAESVLL